MGLSEKLPNPSLYLEVVLAIAVAMDVAAAAKFCLYTSIECDKSITKYRSTGWSSVIRTLKGTSASAERIHRSYNTFNFVA